MRSDNKTRFMSRCVHYKGPWDATNCAAGVERATMLDTSRIPPRRVCDSPDTTIACDKKQLPTEDDWHAKQERDLAALGRMAAIRLAIFATGETQGSLDCPCCNGRVGFSIAGNGHVAAACSTPGCAKWIE